MLFGAAWMSKHRGRQDGNVRPGGPSHKDGVHTREAYPRTPAAYHPLTYDTVPAGKIH